MTEHGWHSRIPVALVMLGLVILAYFLREHWGHALGVAPYVLLLACPLLHLFHGHGDHHRGHRPTEPTDGPQGPGPRTPA